MLKTQSSDPYKDYLLSDLFRDGLFYYKTFNLANYFSDTKPKDEGVLKEFDDFYRFELPVPGIDKKDVKVELNNKYLTVSYNIKENDDKTLFVSNSFCKKMLLPKSNVEKVEATMENGVLVVKVGKIVEKEKQTKVIEIK